MIAGRPTVATRADRIELESFAGRPPRRSAPMLDLRRCRELLGRDDLTDAQVLTIRSVLYGMAQIVVESFENAGRS